MDFHQLIVSSQTNTKTFFSGREGGRESGEGSEHQHADSVKASHTKLCACLDINSWYLMCAQSWRIRPLLPTSRCICWQCEVLMLCVSYWHISILYETSNTAILCVLQLWISPACKNLDFFGLQCLWVHVYRCSYLGCTASVLVLTSGLQRVFKFLHQRCCQLHSIVPFFNLLPCQVSTLIYHPISTVAFG